MLMNLNAVREDLCLKHLDPNRQHLTHLRQVAVAVPSDRLVERIPQDNNRACPSIRYSSQSPVSY